MSHTGTDLRFFYVTKKSLGQICHNRYNLNFFWYLFLLWSLFVIESFLCLITSNTSIKYLESSNGSYRHDLSPGDRVDLCGSRNFTPIRLSHPRLLPPLFDSQIPDAWEENRGPKRKARHDVRASRHGWTFGSLTLVRTRGKERKREGEKSATEHTGHASHDDRFGHRVCFPRVFSPVRPLFLWFFPRSQIGGWRTCSSVLTLKKRAPRLIWEPRLGSPGLLLFLTETGLRL